MQPGLRSTRRANAALLTRSERHGLEERAPRSVDDDEGQLPAVPRPVSGPERAGGGHLARGAGERGHHEVTRTFALGPEGDLPAVG